MRDNAVVLSVEKQMAWVQVSPQQSCGECSARTLCLGRKGAAGRLAVYNPLRAKPGDAVEIEVPEAYYEKEMTRIFGLLLAISVAGFLFGYFVHPLSPLGPKGNALAGLLLGLFGAGIGLARYYRAQRIKSRFPVIVAILNQGGFHGET